MLKKMFRNLLHRRIRAFEQHFDYDASYMHELVGQDLDTLMGLNRFTALAQKVTAAPDDAIVAARLAAAMVEDCGPCAQVVINIALDAGADPALLRALAARDFAAGSADGALGFRFVEALLQHAPELDALREEVIAKLGPGAPSALAFAASLSRTYPVVKRAMGHARACVRLEVPGKLADAA